MKIGLDLDGTLLDCRARQVGLMATLARATGLQLDAARYWQLKRDGLSNRDALGRMGMAPDIAAALCGLWERAIEDVAWLAWDRVLPGVHATLRRWREQGHTLHLVSARRIPVHAEQQLHVLGLGGFASLAFVDPARADAKHHVLERLQAGLYIGDTERDGHCARAAGTVPVLVACGLRSRMYLQGAGDWTVLDNLAQVTLPGEASSNMETCT